MRHDRTRTVNAPLAALDAAGLGEAMRETATDLHALLGEAGVVFEGVDTVYELDMLYTGQTHSVVVPLALPDGGLTGADIAEAFDAAYRAKYGRLLENVPMRVMNMRVAAIGRRPRFDMRAFAPVDGRALAKCRTGTRRLYAEGTWVDAPVYERLAIAVGERVPGPCLLEQADTTIFIDPGLVGVVDEYGNLVIRRT